MPSFHTTFLSVQPLALLSGKNCRRKTFHRTAAIAKTRAANVFEPSHTDILSRRKALGFVKVMCIRLAGARHHQVVDTHMRW